LLWFPVLVLITVNNREIQKFSTVYDVKHFGINLQGTGPNIKHFKNRKHAYNNELYFILNDLFISMFGKSFKKFI